MQLRAPTPRLVAHSVRANRRLVVPRAASPAGPPQPQQVQQQLTRPEDDALRQQLLELQRQVEQAYQAGFRAGYAAGAQVTVSVDLDTGRSLRAAKAKQQAPTPQPQPLPQPQPQPPQQAGAAPPQQVRQQAAGDSLARSAVKGLVWRLFSTTATVGIALLLLHDYLQVEDAMKLGALEFATKYALYFAHERLWSSVKWL